MEWRTEIGDATSFASSLSASVFCPFYLFAVKRGWGDKKGRSCKIELSGSYLGVQYHNCTSDYIVMFFVWFLVNSPFLLVLTAYRWLTSLPFRCPIICHPLTHKHTHTVLAISRTSLLLIFLLPSFFFSFCTPTQIQEFSPRAFFLFIYPPFPWRWFSRECHCSTRTRANFQLFARICQITLNFLVIPKLIN